MIKTSNRKNWLFAIVLSLPMIFFFLGYLFNHSKELKPTGFIQYDNVSYIAYAKQYTDSPSFHILYSNPFNDNDNYARIYFQIQTLFFAFLLKMGIPVNYILIPFTIFCSIACFRIIISIYDFIIPHETFRKRNIWLFAWGGGAIVFAGVSIYFIFPDLNESIFKYLFFVDPAAGWWGLSLGRGLFFSCEAYYHLLFLTCIYCSLKHKWVLSLTFLFLLSISHPFTGIELIGIILSWSTLELLTNRHSVPWWFALGVIVILTFHFYYYLFYLNLFPEHKSVSDQYALNWRLRFFNMIPAYAFVGILTAMSIYRCSLRRFISIQSNRLFLCWFAIALILANHELLITARQPIHFTRGYIWTSLFLLGIPGLQYINNYFKVRAYKIAPLLVFTLFVFDNLTWILDFTLSKSTYTSSGYISKEQENVLRILNQHTNNESTIISNDENISYLSTVYTKGYPWFSHPFTTPFSKRKQNSLQDLMVNKNIDDFWIGKNIVFVLSRNADSIINHLEKKTNINTRIETKDFIIVKSDSLQIINQ